MLNCDQYLMPNTLEEALALWRDAPEGSRLIAGATDILPWAREGRAGDVHLPAMIDVSRVAELQGYTVDGGRVRLGANVVFQQFLTDTELAAHLPCMPHCAIWFADDQIREQATLAGNIVNASPAADGTPAVLALNGEIEMARLDGGSVARRSMPVAEFITGPGRTKLAADEIVTAITCDSLRGHGGSFQKVGQRRSLVISAVCAAAVVRVSDDGRRFEDVRIALGGIGPVPTRLDDIEAMLIGREITSKLIADASVIPADRVASRTRREYRRAVVRGFVEAAIEDALVACGAPSPSAAERENAHV
ncbi:MAG: xanthine dehydrogenase family protein subunit M [Flavobacteriaceae bacterium]